MRKGRTVSKHPLLPPLPERSQNVSCSPGLFSVLIWLHPSTHTFMCACMHARTHTHACMHAHWHQYTYTHTHARTHMHARTHTHTHTRWEDSGCCGMTVDSREKTQTDCSLKQMTMTTATLGKLWCYWQWLCDSGYSNLSEIVMLGTVATWQSPQQS